MATFSVHLIAGALAALLFAGDPFLFLGRQVRLSAADRRDLAAGVVIARTLESGPGEVTAFAASRIDVPPETLIVQARAIEELKRSRFVTAIGRFSDPPRLEDLGDLVLSQREVQAAASCVVGNCSFKLAAPEIGMLRAALDGGASPAPALRDAFRRVVLQRATQYLTAVKDRPREVWGDHAESFLYWSQETYGAGKPVVLVTHLTLVAPRTSDDPALVAGRQVFASHYMTSGSSLMAIATDRDSGLNYLVYLNRTRVDLLGGLFGPLKRAALESRLKRELPEIIQKLRARLERTAAPIAR